MSCTLYAIRFMANDSARLARFWAALLDFDIEGGTELLPRDDTGFRLQFRPTTAPKTMQNRMHLEVKSTSLDHQAATVSKALALGAHHTDVGQTPEDRHVVLADPEGNEFCVIEPGNTFLAECGFFSSVPCDGSRAVGCFWSRALGWPLVWDQDEETAIRSPSGGPKITWGGPPAMPKPDPERLQFVVTVDDASDLERLVSLGATRVREEDGEVVLADPDGTEFRVLTARE
jgi:glyoxalase superfamily protein